MKIKKIYIAAFGGLKDFTLDINDGLNVIYGNNEDGKSTVFAFIKAMFYGTGRNTKSISDSVRLKFTPWDGATMGGRIFFENEGKNYCLEREFRKSDSTDRITLTDLDSGKTIDTTENVGQQFFGLSAAAFERSLFIGNGDFIKDDAAAGEINGKLSNIALTGSEDVSYKQIAKNIFDTRAKLISKSGRSGSYNDDLQLLEELNNRLAKADEDARQKATLNENAQVKRAEYETLYKKYIELKSTLEREQDFKNREKLVDFLQKKRELDQLNQSLKLDDGTIINENYVQTVEFAIGKYLTSAERSEQLERDINKAKEIINLQNTSSPANSQEEIKNLTSEVNTLTAQKDDLESKSIALSKAVEEIKQKSDNAQNKKAAVNPVLLVLSILCAAVCGALAFWVSPIAAALAAGVAVILLILSFVIRPKNTSAIAAIQNELAAANTKLAECKAERNLVLEQINNINARINTLSSALYADAAVKEQRLADLNQKVEELNVENQKAQSALSDVLKLLSDFEKVDSIENAKSALIMLKEKTAEQKERKLQLKTASQFLGNIDYADAEAKLNAMSDTAAFEKVDFDTIKVEYQSVCDKIDALKQELTEIATELKTSFRHSENPEELKRQITELQEKATAKKAFCDAADLAIEVLEESFYELRRGYGSELEKATHDIFSKLTDGKYKSVSVTDTLDLTVEKSDVFGTRELDYLSLGTTHQAYLSLRLAITTLISDNTTLPIFLDDSLSQYDDTRTEHAIKFLKDFCQNGQGILFTCHNSICDIARSQGIDVLKPYK